MQKVLVTGAAGFIGYHVSRRLLERGDAVVGVDNLNDYYDIALKEERLRQLNAYSGYRHYRIDIVNRNDVDDVFSTERPERVINLAAQAGVRHSLLFPQSFVDSNITGFLNILEGCRRLQVEHIAYASSSSVYGANTKLPWSANDSVDHPLSLYAVSKKTNELMAHSYSFLFRLPTTGMRFFNAYGPWGRADSAIFLFTRAIVRGEPIQVFNEGRMARDFTYVDDIAEAIQRLIDRPPHPDPNWNSDHPDPSTSGAPYRIFNVGNHQPVELNRLIEILEECIGRKAIREYLPMQKGDIVNSFAEVENLKAEIGFEPATQIEAGVARFVDWYRAFYHE